MPSATAQGSPEGEAAPGLGRKAVAWSGPSRIGRTWKSSTAIAVSFIEADAAIPSLTVPLSEASGGLREFLPEVLREHPGMAGPYST
jgi:hypothetical protein